MSLLFTFHNGSTWALVGLIWTIQLAHYPLFSEIGRESFQTYHQRYTKRITWVVAPLMFTEIGTAGLMVMTDFREPWFLASLLPLAFNWTSTWLVQVPLHEKLSAGFDKQSHQRLVSTNWWRVAAWSLRGVCLTFMSQSHVLND
jgi:hypothetical protein